MANRQRFPKPIAAEIAKRDRNALGIPRCAWCGATGVKLELHHVKQDAMVLDEDKAARILTANDGAMLCEPCHDAESKRQAPIMAKVKRVEADHLGLSKPKGSIKSGDSENKRRKREPFVPANGVPAILRRFM